MTIVYTPLLVERIALGRVPPPLSPRRTGMGPRRAAGAARRDHADSRARLLVGVGGGLVPWLRPGDLVVATEVRAGRGIVPLPLAQRLAATLRATGLPVHLGPVVSTRRVVDGAERTRLAATGALVVDLESAVLAEAARDRPFAVVRAVVDTPDRPLFGLATLQGGLAGLWALHAAVPALARWARATPPITHDEGVS